MPGIVLDVNNTIVTHTWSLPSMQFSQILNTDKINRELVIGLINAKQKRQNR